VIVASKKSTNFEQIKVKAHGEDTRMIMISTGIDYDDFIKRIKEKFGFRRNCKCKIRDDDGDGMISLSDQEDLDMAISSSKQAARKERAEFGKLEVCASLISVLPNANVCYTQIWVQEV
jgi:predicted RNA-binding protein with RPS1 domain